MYLSKSKYCRLWQCAKQFWLDAYHPELQSENSTLEERMSTGNEVGDLAMVKVWEALVEAVKE